MALMKKGFGMPPDTVILVTRDGMGNAELGLQHILAQKYFQLLLEDGKLPAAICFYADGVKLVCEGSPALAPLQALSERGVLLVVCGTCLNYLHLVDKRQIGIVGGMTDIIEAQWQADKVITI
jgi:intracellular sulfur oxidation DsrE/DsrF family protein